MNRYDRSDVLRILRITAQQLVGWEKAGLIAPCETYSFFDLLQLKKVRDLRAKRVRPAVIRASLQAMQKQVAGMENPLIEAGTFSTGSRVAFRHSGTAVEPLAGQFVMDFGSEERVVSAKVRHMRSAETVGELFARRQANNLAERHYRAAVEVDPRYALGYFDLGNVLDETGRVEEAIKSYRAALALAPTYADAHYNLALAYEKSREPRKALTHWRAYVRLDTSGPWATHARNQIQKILAAEGLKVVFRKK